MNKDYAITYQVTVYISAYDEEKAERNANDLLENCDRGYGNMALSIDKKIRTKVLAANEY